MSTSNPPAIGQPTLRFQYASQAGSAQNVCSLSGASGLLAQCVEGFPSHAGTLSAWVKTSSTDTRATVFAYRSPASRGGLTLVVSNPADLSVAFGGDTADATGVAINDGLWRQLVVTFERISWQNYAVGIFLDGLQLYQTRGLSCWHGLADCGDFYLGSQGSNGTGLPCLVSELQVWGRLLSADEIVTGVFRRATDGAAGLVLHWPLDTLPVVNPDASIVASDLRFRTGAALMTWDAVAGATSYEIAAGSTDGLWNETAADITQTSHSSPAAPLNKTLGAKVRAYQQQSAGPWSDQLEINAFELGQAAVTLNWNDTGNTLTASWPDVPRRDTFTLELYQGDSQQPTVTSGYNALTYDLTSKVDDPSSWRLDVRAFAGGSLGPAEPTIDDAAPRLTLLYDSTSRQLLCSWEPVAGAQYYRLQIVPPSGGTSYLAMLDGNATQAVVTNEQYPLTTGTTYAVRLRALGSGTVGQWASVPLTPHAVAAPTLSWVYTQASDALDATWNAVTAGATYNLKLYSGSGQQPIDHREGMTTRSYPMGNYLGTNSAYRLLVSAVDDSVEGPANQPAAPAALNTSFQYLADTHTLQLGWSQQQSDAYLRLFQGASQTPFQSGRFTDAQASFGAPPQDFPEGTVVNLNIRGLTPGYLGTIDTASLTIHLLTRPVPTLAYSGTGPTLTASWPAINPPLQVAYQEQTSIDGQAQPIQDVTGTSVDVTSLLSRDGALVVNVRGTADNSIGPWSDGAAAATPTALTLTFDVTTSKLNAGWTAAGLNTFYAELWKAGDTAPSQRAWVTGSAAAEFDVSGLLGQTVTVKVRAVNGNALSTFVAAAMTLAQVSGPLLGQLSGHTSPNQITAPWSFDAGSVTGTLLGFTAELQQGGQALLSPTIDDPAARAYTFEETSTVHFNTGTTYSVIVRARVQPAAGQTILGSWSQPQSLTFGLGNLGVRNFQVTSDSNANLTLTWGVDQSFDGETFEVQIPAVSFTRAGLTGTLANLSQSDTHVVGGTTYDVQIRACLPGNVCGDWSHYQVQAGRPAPPPDPPPHDRGDPVSLATGAFTYTNTDLYMAAVVPLSLVVYYKSDSPLPGDNPGLPSTPIGARWNHSYNTRIEKAQDGKTVAVIWDDLRVVVYNVPPSTTGYYSQQGISDGSTLFVDSNLNYTLTTRTQLVYGFNPQGALQWTQTPAGNRTNLSYSNNRLSRVTDAGSGRYLSFSYDGNGRIQTVSTSAGAHIGYLFDGGGNLTQYTDPLGSARKFTYDGQSRILTAEDANRQVYVKNTYDSAGRVSFQQDARAIADRQTYGTTFQYAEQGNNMVVTVTNRLGQTTTYTFDKATQLMSSEVVDLGGGKAQKTLQTYDGNGNMLTRSVFEGDAASSSAGNVWRYAYDGNNNVVATTDPLGGTESFTYNAQNQQTGHTDRLGNVTRYVYQNNLLTQIVDPLNQPTTFTYKPGSIKGLVETVTDIYGAVTRYEYDGQGQLTQVTDASGAITVVTYDSSGWQSSSTRKADDGTVVLSRAPTTNAMGWVTSLSTRYTGQTAPQAFVTGTEYDGNGKVTSVTNPLTATTGYQYDPDGSLKQITYPANGAAAADTSVLGYDREERLTSIDYGINVVERFDYDALNRIASQTDPNGNVTLYTYAMIASATGGGFDLVQTTTLPVNAPGTQTPLTRQVRLNALGQVVSQTDTAGGVTAYTYTPVAAGPAHGLKVLTTLPKTGPSQAQPYTTSETRDAIGRVVERVNEADRHTTYAYAAASTVPDAGAAVLAVTTTRPSGLTVLELYDGLGRVVETRRGSGGQQRSTKLTYDPLGRVVRVLETSGAVTGTTTCDYRYSDGNLAVAVNTYGQTGPSFRFDALGQPLSATDQAGKAVLYTYTPRGQVSTFKNARNQTLAYQYDRAGRLTGMTLPGDGGALVHELDLNGNRKQTTLAGAVKVTRTFDHLNRLLTRTDEQGQAVSYSYDARGKLAALTYPAAQGQTPPQVAYTYDGLGRMTGATDWANRSVAYTYFPAGAVETSTAPNGTSVRCAIDDDGRLTELTTKVGDIIVARATYGYNAFDEVTSLSQILPAPPRPPAGTRPFTYAGTRMLTAGTTNIAYDDDGNMTSLPNLAGALSYDVFNELTAAGDFSFQFDVDGLRLRASAGQQAHTYTYDIEGYFNPWREQADPAYSAGDAALQRLPSGGLSVTPVAEGARRQAALGPLDRVLAESDGATQTRYLHALGLVGSETADGKFTSYVFDGQGSTLALVDGTGAVVRRHAYDPFGALVGGDALTQPFGFVGRYGVVTDANGLYYMRARSYAPALMRFTGQDYLLGHPNDPQTINRYLYVENNTLLRIDPLGEDKSIPWGTIFGIGGAILGAGLTIYFLPEILTGLGSGIGGLGGLLRGLGASRGFVRPILDAGTVVRNLGTRLRVFRAGLRPRFGGYQPVPVEDPGIEMVPM
jgi:RHS repeat-associated protein